MRLSKFTMIMGLLTLIGLLSKPHVPVIVFGAATIISAVIDFSVDEEDD